MLVCHCAAVNDRRIREAIARGADDLVAIADDCGAGSFCGGCQPTIEALLAEATGRAPTGSPPVGAPSAAARGDAPPARRAARVAFRSVVRSVEEDVLTAGWDSGQPLGTPPELARRYRCTKATLTRATWVLEQHGILRADPATGHVRVGEPDEAAIAEAAALHLCSTGLDADRLDRARRLLALPREAQAVSPQSQPEPNPAVGILRRTLTGVAHLHRHATSSRTPATSASDLARRLAGEIHQRGCAPRDLVGTERELRARHGVSAELLYQATTLLEYYAVAHRHTGPDGGVVVSASDPWPTAQLLAMYLEHAGLTASQLFDVRVPLEIAAVERATRVASADGIALLRRRLDEERLAHQRHRHADFASAGHHDIHVVLAEICTDPVVRLFVDALKLVAVRVALRSGTATVTAERDARLLSDHEAITEAVAAGDADLARRWLNEHLRWLDPSPA